MLGRLEGCTRCRCCELSPSRPHLRLAPFSTATALPTRATWFSSAPWELAARSGMVARSAPLPVGTPMPAWLAWLRSDRNYVTSECNRGRRGAGYVVSPLQTVIQILSHRSARSVRRASQPPAQGLRLGSGSHGSNSKYSLIHGRAIAYQSTLQSLATPVRNGPKAARVHGACPAPPPLADSRPNRAPRDPCSRAAGMKSHGSHRGGCFHQRPPPCAAVSAPCGVGARRLILTTHPGHMLAWLNAGVVHDQPAGGTACAP